MAAFSHYSHPFYKDLGRSGMHRIKICKIHKMMYGNGSRAVFCFVIHHSSCYNLDDVIMRTQFQNKANWKKTAFVNNRTALELMTLSKLLVFLCVIRISFGGLCASPEAETKVLIILEIILLLYAPMLMLQIIKQMVMSDCPYQHKHNTPLKGSVENKQWWMDL